MAKSCPTVAKSQVQSVFAVLEDVSGELQPPSTDGYILPAGRATMTQTPSYSDSEELSPSLNTIDQFQDAVPAGTGSIPLYGRLDSSYGKPEGDALLVALMGDYNDPTKITAAVSDVDGVTASDTEITINAIVNGNDFDGNILKGKLPPRGVVKIDSENIRYGKIVYNDDDTATLLNCKRGYGGSTAAAHDDAAAVQLLSRVYSQNTCRPTCSIYIMNDDKLMLFMSGCSVIQDVVRLQRTQGQMFTFDFQGRRMGWCGVGEVAEAPVGTSVKLAAGGADAYSVGGYIRNKTRGDDNSGQGYRIAAVDDESDTLTLSAAPTGWQVGDALHPWLPSATPIGKPMESRFGNVEIDGKVGKMNEGSLTISCPVTNLEEMGDEYPGEGIDTKRAITLSRTINFRAKDGVEFGKGYRGYELPVTALAGKYAGLTLAHYKARVKFNTPEVGEGDNAITLTQDGTALGVTGEDALFIIQE